MGARHTLVAVGLIVVVAIALARPAVVAQAAEYGVPDAVPRTIVGSTGGTVDVYHFRAPTDIGAPVVDAVFSPADLADGSRVGFEVWLNGNVVGSGGTVAGSPGLLQYTLPHDPAGQAIVQVFAYVDQPVGFSIALAGVPATPPGGGVVAPNTYTTAFPLTGEQHGVLPANRGGSYAYYRFTSAGASPPATVDLTYSPADERDNQAVGFNVFDEYQNNIGSATQAAGINQPSNTLSLSLSRTPGEPLTLDVFNYASGIPVTYIVTVSGVAPPTLSGGRTPTNAATPAPAATGSPASAPASAPTPTSSPSFAPFWVENFALTPLWSGPDQQATSFGFQPQFSHFLVVSLQQGSRLYIYNPTTQNYAYINADRVGPSGPPGS